MKNLKIEYKFNNKNDMKAELLKFNKKGDLFHTELTGGCISIYFDSVLLKPLKENGKYIKDEKINGKVVITDWIWDWAAFFAYYIPKLNEKEVNFTSLDNHLELKISKKDAEVYIELSGYLKGNIKTEYKNFIKEVYSFTNSFANDLLSINPNLVKNEQFKQIIEGRDKIKKMLEETQNEL